MKKQIRFELDDSSSFSVDTVNYFRRAGFRVVSALSDEISFTKGSVLQNMFTFNALSWKSDVRITYSNGEVVAIFEVNTFGQAVTPKEEQLWNTFVGNFRRSLIEKVDLNVENEREMQETKMSNLKYVKWAIIGGIVCGIPSGVIAYYTGLDSLAAIGAAGGASLVVMYKVNKDRRNVSR
ncbi:MAG: hypothetical protein QM762_18505 [Chryseolinea sp.]